MLLVRVGFYACMLGAIEMRNAVTFILGWCSAERISVSDSIYIKYQTKIKTSVLRNYCLLSSFAWKTSHFSFIRWFFHASVRSFVHQFIVAILFLIISCFCLYFRIAHFEILLPRYLTSLPSTKWDSSFLKIESIKAVRCILSKWKARRHTQRWDRVNEYTFMFMFYTELAAPTIWYRYRFFLLLLDCH